MTQGSEIDEVLREFLSESKDNLDQFESTLLEAERAPHTRGLMAALFRSIHSIKGSCAFLNLQKLEAVLHLGETLLGRIRDGRLALDTQVSVALLRMVDVIRRMLAILEATGKEGETEHASVLELLERVADRAAPSGATAPPIPDANDESGARPSTDGKIRVNVELLDRLMNLVGELVLARNQVVQLTAAQGASGVGGPVQRLSLVTTELQETVMKTRMQPIGNVWSRFPRVVRDLAKALGKEVELQLEGRETELDKSIIEAIGDPLAHLVRNAVAHGIESKASRATNGKPPVGTLSLRAFHEGGMVNIEVEDDGTGIDVAQVKRRAGELNLVPAELLQRMSDREAVGLIFLPGFTTTEKADTVSGRGVGMDVVRTNIEKLGGSVDVQTRPGKGTTIKLKIPLTLAIIPALIVGSGGVCYAIPQASLLEVVRLETDSSSRQIERIQGAPVFRLRGKLLPLAYLNQELGLSAAAPKDSAAIVVLQADERTFGLVVDEIRDTEEIVVKPLWKRLKSLSCYAGATVMGDGRVALILDSMGLGQQVGLVAESRQQHTLAQQAVAAEKARQEELILLCQLGGAGRLAIPLAKVARLEELPRSRIEQVGSAMLAQYRGNILPIAHVGKVLQERRSHPRDPEGAARSAQSDVVHLVVFSHEDRQVGLMVDGILDVVGVRVALQERGARPGVLGTMVVKEKITEFLDVDRAILAADGMLKREEVRHV
jgi:two-component system chemotaxis sensor kinase CheA